jgi:hypothetical protein
MIDHFRGEDMLVVGTGIDQGLLEKYCEPMETLDQNYEEVLDLLQNPQGRVSFDYGESDVAITVPEKTEVEIVDMDDIFKIPRLPAKYYGGMYQNSTSACQILQRYVTKSQVCLPNNQNPKSACQIFWSYVSLNNR